MKKVDWRSHFVEHGKSGLSVAEYCRRHHISPSAFYLARKRDRERPSFTPVVVKEARRKASHFEISLAVTEGGFVEFRGITNDKQLLSALMAGACS